MLSIYLYYNNRTVWLSVRVMHVIGPCAARGWHVIGPSSLGMPRWDSQRAALGMPL